MDINTLCLILGLTPEQVAWVTAILGILFALSEALALIPSVKSNSVYQLVSAFLKKVLKKNAAAKSAVIMVCMCGLLTGCASTTGTTIKTLEVEKVVAVETMIAAYQANKAGALNDADLKKIEGIFTKWRTTHIEAVKIMDRLRTVTDEGQKVKLDALLKELPVLIENLKTVAAAYGLGVAK